jgi:hypothetical protein
MRASVSVEDAARDGRMPATTETFAGSVMKVP